MDFGNTRAAAGAFVFYNDSGFDGHDPAANAMDEFAIATDKAPLRPGEAATFANVTSYVRGLNGVMIDLPGVNTVGLSDFSFRAAVSATRPPGRPRRRRKSPSTVAAAWVARPASRLPGPMRRS